MKQLIQLFVKHTDTPTHRHTDTPTHRHTLILLLLLSFFTGTSQQTWCETVPTTNSVGYHAPTVNEEGPFYVRIYVHVLRRTDGTGGQTREQVKEGLRLLDISYNSHNIFFVWDCEIDYIDDTGLFNSSNLTSAFTINNHVDGIDMYLGPEVPFPSSTGNGFASDVISAEFYVTGSFWEFPYDNLTTSPVIAHEMGHCLGLYHTFEGASNQLVDEPMCQNGELFYDDGDFVCDTPADPNMNFAVDPNSCHWNGQEYDDEGDLYNPDETNIMAYSNIECQDLITLGQGQRIRNLLVSEPVLSACLVNFDSEINNQQYFSNTTISVGNHLVIGDIIVESGATLTIPSGAILNFQENSKLIVKRNARLVLNGTLSSFCGTTWKGVEVWSNASQSQYYNFNTGNYAQGRFTGNSGAVIENAEIGVQLWGPELHQGGGIITANETTFRNNEIGIQTAPYENFWPYTFGPPSWFGQPRPYYGQFQECNFETNENYPHQSPFIFIDLSGVNGIRINGCSFKSTYQPDIEDCADFSIEKYGIGIHANDSGFKVYARCLYNTPPSPFDPCDDYIRSEFSGLGYGILANHLIVNRPFEIRQTDFEDCFIGISTTEVDGATLLHNEFKLGNLPNSECWNDQMGVYLARFIDGITFQENLFIDDIGGDVNTIGTNVFHTWEFNKNIRKNRFVGLDYANLAGGRNANFMGDVSGVHYECNIMENTTQYDFLVSDVPIFGPDNVRNIQGVYDDLTNIVSLPAGNEFSYTGAPFARDFRNVGSNLSLVEYYYVSQGNEKPMDFLNIDDIEIFVSNPCPTEFCLEPCPSDVPYDETNLSDDQNMFYQKHQDYKTAQSDYELAINAGNDALANQKLLAAGAARQERDKVAQNILGYLMADTLNYNRDTVRTWWKNLESYSADLTVVGDYVATNQWAEASAILNAAPTKYNLSGDDLVDWNTSVGVYNMIYQKSLYGLDGNDLENLKTIADNSYGHSSGLARSIRELYKVQFYPPIYALPNEHGDDNKRIAGDKQEHIQYKLTAYPNPATDFIIFSWNELPQQPQLKIYNSMGREIWQGNISTESEQFSLSVDKFPSGIYFYQLYTNGKLTNAPLGKLIIQNN